MQGGPSPSRKTCPNNGVSELEDHYNNSNMMATAKLHKCMLCLCVCACVFYPLIDCLWPMREGKGEKFYILVFTVRSL